MEYFAREFVTTTEAAVLLGVVPSQVRSLLRANVLTGTHVGSQWVVSRAAIATYLEHSHQVGRPFSQRIAWSLLAEKEGVRVPWELHRQERARLRRYAPRPLVELAHRLSARARTARVSVGPGVFERLAEHPKWRLGGLSGDAADDMAIIYVPAGAYESVLEDTNAVVDREQPNLLIHVVEEQWWPFEDARRGAPVWNVVAELDRFDRGGHMSFEREIAPH